MKKEESSGELFFHSLKKKLLIVGISLGLLFSGILQVYANSYNLKHSANDGRISSVQNNLTLPEESQQVKVAGTITDATTGEPLVGVNIVLEGSTIGVMTDINGKYSIAVGNLNGKLKISYIGYTTQEVPINGMMILDVKLTSDILALEDVVVVGYGSQKKINVTGSVATISGTEMKTLPVKDVGTALVGRLPGIVAVNQGGVPGQNSPSISIRGFANMLTIVDGVEYPFGWDQLDMVDIESISVLKDASASIYGARAGNGVLLITTKRGKMEAPTFNFNASYGFESPTRMPHPVDASTFARMSNEAGLTTWTPDQIEKFKTGTDPAYPNTDWYGEVFKKSAPIAKYNLSSTGGNEKLNYYFSLGYFNNGGMLKSGDLNYNRINFRSNVEAKIARGFTASVKIGVRQEKTDAPAASQYQSNDINDLFWLVLQDANFAQPTFPAHYPDPTKLAFTGHGSTQPIGRSYKSYSGYTNNDTKYLDGEVNLKYETPFIKGLSARANFATNNAFSYTKQFGKQFSYWNYNPETDIYSNPMPAQQSENLDRETMYRFSQLTSQIQMNYDRTFGSHSINALILGEYIDYGNNTFFGFRKNYLSTAVEQLFAGGDADKDASGSQYQDGRIGYAGRLNYSYAGKYLAEVTVRMDASSRYSADNRWGTFPSLSLGWRLSEEQFLKNVSVINNLKLRGSVGKAGSDADVPPYTYMAGYQYGQGNVFGTTIHKGIISTGIPNPNLIWQTSTNYNIGIDGGFWKNMLSVEFDLFYRKVENVAGYRSQSIPITFGAGLPLEPINSFDDRGFELTLKHENNVGELRYSVVGMVTYARSKWIHYDEPTYPDNATRERLGLSGQWKNRLIGYSAAGLFQTQQEIDNWADQDLQGNSTIRPGDIKYEDYNKDGVIDYKDEHEIGKGYIPDVMFSFNLLLEYKGFDFNVLLQGASGFNAFAHQRPFENGTVPFTYMTDYWTSENTGAKYPRLVSGEAENNKKVSSFWLMDATYLRLKNITLGYTIPKSLTAKLKIRSCRIFITGLDILTFDNVYPLDPESGYSMTGNGGYRYPRMKNYQGGIDLNF
jgi:TonB-linked SusC/RagA family outer membrane protein